MSKRDDIKKIWQESFNDSRSYVEMYFERVYRDEDAMTLVDEKSVTVSSLLLQRFNMSFHGSVIPVSYIAGAATRRSQRGKGYMSTLLRDSLEASAERGDMLCALIPSRLALYYFYARYGFSTVFYSKEQRFTSLHSFPVAGCYGVSDGQTSEDTWLAFDRFQRKRTCYILHSRRDFDNIQSDLEADGGDFVAVEVNDEDSGPVIVSMAWAVMRDDLLVVTDVMGEDADARTAALHELRRLHPDVPFLVLGDPSDATGGRLMPRGMARVVNAGLLLECVAQGNPAWVSSIRVTDPLLPDINSHTYLINRGKVTIDDGYKGKLDLDVPVDVLADIAFSAPSTGEIMRFPSERPMISLMLD